MADAIRLQQERVRKGWKPVNWKALVSLDADRMALITLSCILNSVGQAANDPDVMTVTRLSWRIGYSCWRERRGDAFLGRAFSLEEVTAARNKRTWKARKSAREVEAAIDKARWTRKHLDVHLGGALLALALEHSGILDEGRNAKRAATISLTHQAALKFLDARGAKESTLLPTNLPMVHPPVPWGGNGRGGGYLVFEMPLVKRDETDSQEVTLRGDPTIPCRVLDVLQETPWRIKRWIAEIVRTAWDRKAPAEILPPASVPEGPDLPDKNSVDAETWSRLRWEHDEALRRRAEALSRHSLMDSRLAICSAVGARDAIYFPAQYDYRSRLYAVPEIVHPQADDMSRALLEFADGKPLGERGAFWLAVWVATLYGHGIEKWSFERRADWTHQRRQEILDCERRPHDGALFWLKAENPLRFLSACEEWARYLREGPGFPSRIPVAMDGTCNGLQHLSALGRDPEGGRWTNLVPSSSPQDLYQVVADRLADTIDEAAARGDRHAAEWRGAIDRRLVKEPTMTTQYGVTDTGIRDQLLDVIREDHPDRFENPWRAATYLAEKVREAIGAVVVKGAEIRAWLQEVARLLGRAKRGVHWRVPTGFEVIHECWKEDIERVRTLRWTLQLRKPNPKLGIYVRDQVNGIVAHVVHSLDASHMMKTVLALRDRGVRHMSMVHDSYAVHACDVDSMRHIARDTFAELHEEFTLARLHHQFKACAPDGVKLPKPLRLGRLDLAAVRESEYFFC